VADEIIQMPLLAESLPYTFADGGILKEIGINCGGCGRLLGSRQIHGTLGGRANKSAAVLTCFGVCYECKTLSPCDAKFFSDGSSLHKKDSSWVRECWNPGRNSLGGHRVLLYLYAHWQEVIPPVIAVLIICGWLLKG